MDPADEITHKLSATMRAINITLPKILLKRLYIFFSTPLLHKNSLKSVFLPSFLLFLSFSENEALIGSVRQGFGATSELEVCSIEAKNAKSTFRDYSNEEE